MSDQPVCLSCGVSIYAEDGGLCSPCAAQVHGPEPEPAPAPAVPLHRPSANDPRFNAGLLFDVLGVLDEHGYRRADDPKHLARTLVRLIHLVEAYEGKESPNGQ